MDFFGLVRITVTWLPGADGALWGDEPGGGEPGSDQPGAQLRQPAAELHDPAAVPPLVADAPAAPAAPAEAPPAAPADLPPAPGEDVVQSLIGLADDVAELAGQAAENEAAGNLLRLAQWRVDRVLADCGVAVLADEGPVDPARHMVAGTRPAGTDGTAGWIAATVRRGYLRNGELIRPQQVVAYTRELQGGARGGSDDAGED